MALNKELTNYEKAFYKLHGRNYSQKEVLIDRPEFIIYKMSYLRQGETYAKVFYTKDGVIDPFMTYSSQYIKDVYIKEHPLDIDEEEAKEERKEKKEKDDDKGCCGAWYCCPFRCSWKLLCSFLG